MAMMQTLNNMHMILHFIDRVVIPVCALPCVFSRARSYPMCQQILLHYWVRLLPRPHVLLLEDAKEEILPMKSGFSR
jgi:hypothetical protein